MRHMSRYATFVASMPPSKTNSALLTRREREIMNAVFALGNRASADEIRARLTNPPGDSAVRVMLAARKEGLPETPARRPSLYLLRHDLAGRRETHGATAVFADFLRRLTAADDDGSGNRGVVDR